MFFFWYNATLRFIGWWLIAYSFFFSMIKHKDIFIDSDIGSFKNLNGNVFNYAIIVFLMKQTVEF